MIDDVLGLSANVADPSPGHPVLRNTLFLTVGQIVGVPLSMLANVVTARYLGPTAFGYMYIGATLNSFGFLVVDWGQLGALPGLVATDRQSAGQLLGTSLVWRGLSAVVIYGVLIGLCHVMGYEYEVRVVVGLFFVGYAVSAITNACQAVIVGFERIEVAAYRQILEQFAVLAIVVPILILGGGLNAALVGHAATTVIALLYVWGALPSLNIGRLSVNVRTLKGLLSRGTPFVFLNVAMVLQPTIDVAFLSKLAQADVVGWYSAARRLIGFLVFPAAALVGALYPTLCRLHATDSKAFLETTRGALRGTSVLVIPVALGCLLFPDIGIALYNRSSFLPAEANLRVLSLFLFLIYFTMPLGISVMAAGRQREWAIVQFSCVLTSLVLDPLLIPSFQHRTGNGGLGLCVATVVSEIIVLVCGILLVPRGVFDRQLGRSFLPALASGATMVAVAKVLQSTTSFVAAPVAVTAYIGCLWITGGIDKEFVAALRELVHRKLSR